MADLSKSVIPIVMSGETKWTLEPWHIRLAFLAQGVFIDEQNIEMPKISGPSESLENGEFLLQIKVK